MIKKIFTLLSISIIFLTNSSVALADTKGAFDICNSSTDTCITGYSCQPSESDPATSLCQPPLGAFEICKSSNAKCVDGYSCQPSQSDPKTLLCQKSGVFDVFGKVTPPNALKELVGAGQSGAEGIGIFFSRLIALIYAIAMVVLIIMLLWGAFDWMTSEGNKEKLEGAQKKIINAIIGILLFAVAFAVIQVIGTFTGFHFFEGQK